MQKPKDYWKNVLWMDETKIEAFELNEKCYVWHKGKHCISIQQPHGKYNDGSIIVWAYFGLGWLAIIDGTMIPELCHQILKENIRESIWDLKSRGTGSHRKMMTQDIQIS